MDKVYVVYWSQSGNTQAMAEAIGKGVTAAGKEAAVQFVSEASVEDLKNVKGFALGCPAMGAEVLEEMEMEPFVCELEGFVAGKTIALFGSYGYPQTAKLEKYLFCLKKRLCECNGFPHEIGVFLGYPLDDVKGFILNKGRGCKCCGLWKVYCNECETRKLFDKIQKCTQVYLQVFEEGRNLTQMTVCA